MSGYCGSCGGEITGADTRFCAFCGAEVTSPEPDEPSIDETSGASAAAAGDETTRMPAAGDGEQTLKMQAVPLGGQALPVQAAGSPAPTSPPVPPEPSKGRSPWVWAIPVGIAGVLLVAGLIGTAIYLTFLRGDSGGTSSAGSGSKTATVTETVVIEEEIIIEEPVGDSRTRAYITTMDDLIAQNAAFEKEIAIYADQINKVAPAGITDRMLTDIDTLTTKFLTINNEVKKLDTPAAFGTSTRDFRALTSYNMDRCNALYSGANAWRNGQAYNGYFEQGRVAKESYQSLYPFFESEYNAAKAAAR